MSIQTALYEAIGNLNHFWMTFADHKEAFHVFSDNAPEGCDGVELIEIYTEALAMDQYGKDNVYDYLLEAALAS
ncbi:MAG: hypothetical protein F4109_05605 [Gammaproteobacteria bacterium]|nr:hypothetical protein [Gammaproteobacteria bacterium]MYD01142.1 hypothetical protein [Gammaproteobacteria bacterium]MYI24890.1 hypothetical protein [Gammaproteobacteria bacterium]